jgi:hypothetical protein
MFNVGDKVFDARYGKGVVDRLDTNTIGIFTVCVVFNKYPNIDRWYTDNGCLFRSAPPSLEHVKCSSK